MQRVMDYGKLSDLAQNIASDLADEAERERLLSLAKNCARKADLREAKIKN